MLLKNKLSVKNGFSYLKRNWFILFSVIVYAFFTFYYMGPSITNCSTTVYGFGDNTAGPIRTMMIPDKQGLLGSYSSVTNAPFGDNIYSPVGYSQIGQTVFIRSIQKLAGPICGYNIVNVLGFMSSALVMCGLIYFLIRNKWIALFAGYAVGFSSYYQMKIGGHPSYGYQSILIGIIWLFLRLMKYKRLKDAVFLGLFTGVSLYFDPYFTLFIALILSSMGAAWLISSRYELFALYKTKKSKMSKKPIFKELKLALIAIGVLALTMMPLVVIYINQAKNIESTVAAYRGNVIAEAKACSNYPQEYLTPFVLNPIFERVFGADRYHTAVETIRGGITCGIGEDSVSLSIILVIIVFLFSIIFAWERINGRRLGMNKILFSNPKLVYLSILLIGLIGFLIALPPVRFHGVPTLSYILLAITYTWRTLTRGYMLVNIALVIFSSIAMAYVFAKFKKHKKIIIMLFLLTWFVVLVEYQSFAPFSGNTLSTFDYVKDAPSAYLKLKAIDDVNIIAEYPLEQYGKESDAMSYYLTMQTIHSKKLFNSALASGPYEQYKDGLKDLADPQTLPALRLLGVDMVILHGVSEIDLKKAIPGVEVAFSETQARFNINSHSPIVGYDNIIAINLMNITPAEYYFDLGDGFARNTNIIKSSIDWNYEAIDNSEVFVRSRESNDINILKANTKVCFDAKMSVESEKSNLSIDDGGKTNVVGEIDGVSSKRFVFNVSSGSFKISADNGHNMRISNLGCGSAE